MDLLRRVLLFEGGHVCIQKLVFFIFKVVYYSIDDMTYKSSMVNYAMPFNLMCGLLTGLYVLLKLRDIRTRKAKGGIANPQGEETKEFLTSMTQTCIKFK